MRIGRRRKEKRRAAPSPMERVRVMRLKLRGMGLPPVVSIWIVKGSPIPRPRGKLGEGKYIFNMTMKKVEEMYCLSEAYIRNPAFQ